MRRGFTLIELLMVTAVFSLTVLVATTVFTRIQSSQRGILGRQRVVADGRYILEAMARTAKLGLPDYAFYASAACQNVNVATTPPCGLTVPQSMLVVRDQTNAQTCYRLSGGNIETSTDCTAASPVWTDITPTDLVINDFRVYILPTGDPFRSPPASAADCPTTSTQAFDPAAGVCGCTAATTLVDCFAGQTCSSVTNPGQCFSGDTCICQNPNVQPYVAIYLKTSSTNAAAGEQASTTMETSVVSRIYRR